MERGSDKHSPRLDEVLESEVAGMLRAGRETRAEEWNSAEPSGEDQPDVDRAPNATLTGGLPDGLTPRDVEGRSELATYLGKEVWPADGTRLLERARDAHAPERVLDVLRQVPPAREFASVGELWAALSGGHEEHRF